MKDPGGLRETLSFGRPGEDVLPINPTAVSRLNDEHRWTMLAEGEDEPERGEEWPPIAGDRIVFSSFNEDESVPIAIVAAEQAGDPAVLADIASQSDDHGSIEVQTTYDAPAPFRRPKRRASLWDFALVSSRLIAVYVVLRLLLNLGPHGFADFFSPQGPVRWFNLVFLLALVGTAVGLWVKAPALADRLVPESKRAVPTIRLGSAGLQSLVFSSIGVFFIATAVPGIVGTIAHFVAAAMTENSIQEIPLSFPLGQLFQEVSRLIVGLLLVIGSKKMAEMIQRLRPSYAYEAPGEIESVRENPG